MAMVSGHNDVQLYIEEYGDGPQTIVFSHGYLMNHRMFEAQIERLKDRYHIVAYDHRGHGMSAPARTRYDIYALMEDAAKVIEARAQGRAVHFVGMSTGGYVATRLMIRRPDLIRSAILIDTASAAEDADSRGQYNLLLFMVRWLGMRPVQAKALAILMGEPFRTDRARRSEFEAWKKEILALDRSSVVAFGKAIFDRDDVTEALRGTQIPAVVIVGELDQPTPPEKARQLAEAVGAEVIVIPRAGHTSPIENPGPVTEAIEAFLAKHGGIAAAQAS